MISRTAEYALRAVVHLAAASSGGAGALTVGQIAAGTRVPTGYLAKVLQSLCRAGVITSQRGTGGGFRLARPAAKISIYEVVQAVDSLQRIRKCPLGLKSHSSLCPLHQRLDDAMAQIEKQFRATSIGELVGAPATGRVSRDRPCSFPADAGAVHCKAAV